MRLLSGGAAQGLVESLRAGFESETGHGIEGTFGAVGAMRDKLLSGEACDLVILSRVLVETLAKQGHVDAASMADIGPVETAVAVRAGDPAPALSRATQLREALLVASAIHFPDPRLATAGIHFDKVMQDFGIRDRVADRLRPAPNGTTAMRALAADQTARPIGCTQATEILATAGLVLVAALPPGCELATIYTAGITTKAGAPDAAKALIARLTDPARRNDRHNLGFG